MISLDKLTESDIGREVIYSPRFGPEESGQITSFSKRFVFVDYTGNGRGIATTGTNLNFADKEEIKVQLYKPVNNNDD